MTSYRSFAVVGLASAYAFAVGCSGATGDSARCEQGSDCNSGVCASNGECVAVVDGGGDDAVLGDSPLPVDDAAGVTCTGNHDGIVTASEVPLIPGLHANYRTATNATVDVAGTTQPDGSLKWDLSGALNGDKDVEVDTVAVPGTWYATDFSSASYASALTAGSDDLGVFQTSSAALKLLGVVSSASGTTETLLTYATPPRVLAYPIAVGGSFSDSSLLSGTTTGIATTVTDTYSTTVDARGTLLTPYGSFDVLRVRTTLTRLIGALPEVTLTVAFVAECFGTVATVTSNTDETQANFTTAATVQRLSP